MPGPLVSSDIRYRNRYTAVMPQPGWARGRPPRERARKHRARADLIAGLDRYIRASSFVSVRPGSEATNEGAIAQWIVWAARLGEPDHATAPDASQWRITTRREAR